jgi:hypothetical protein
VNSVYTKVIVWCFGAILVSLVAFVFIDRFVAFHSQRGGIMGAIDAMALDQAVSEDRMAAAVAAHPRARAEEIRDRTVADVNRFTGFAKSQDDRTPVVIVHASENDTALDEVEAFALAPAAYEMVAGIG